MTETRSTSQNSTSQNSEKQNLEKIAALSKVFENHKHALQEIQKQLQTITEFMQRIVEVEDKHQKVMMALYHLEEETLIWFQDAEQAGGFPSWEVFIKALQTRFGVTAYDDPMEALIRLK